MIDCTEEVSRLTSDVVPVDLERILLENCLRVLRLVVPRDVESRLLQECDLLVATGGANNFEAEALT